MSRGFNKYFDLAIINSDRNVECHDIEVDIIYKIIIGEENLLAFGTLLK